MKKGGVSSKIFVIAPVFLAIGTMVGGLLGASLPSVGLACQGQALAQEPKTWYVAEGLQDYNGADFTKVQQAVDAAAGDAIIVYPGTYTENVDGDKSLTIESQYGAEGTTVQATDPLNIGTPTKTAPEEEWNKTFGGSNNDHAYSVRQTSDGGYIITGFTWSYGAGKSDVWLIKTDSNGDEEWNKTFGGSDCDGGSSVQQTSDGGYIIVGHKGYGVDYSDVWLIKTDSMGNEEWNKTFGRSHDDGGCSVQQTSDGGYIIVGHTGYSYHGDVWLIKTDSNGNEEWNKIFDGLEGFRDGGRSVQQTADGGYIITGYTASAGHYDVWLIKTDSNGDEEWNKRFSSLDWDDYGESVQQTSDGGYIIAGLYGYGDVWLIKTDSSGDEEWNKRFKGQLTDWGKEVQQTSDGGYVIVGWTRWRYDLTQGEDVWLIKTDSNGNKEWDKRFGGSGDNSGESIQQRSDGGYIIAGFNDEPYGAGGGDVWLIKVKGEEENNPPNMPSSPSPTDGATDVPIEVDLSWTGGDPDPGDTVTYNVSFGTSETPPFKETIGPHAANQTSLSYELSTLAYNTTYYWQIIATDNHEAETTGPVWNFITAAAWDPWAYDEDDSSYIEIGELLQAINDYIGGDITISQLLEMINLYISHTHK